MRKMLVRTKLLTFLVAAATLLAAGCDKSGPATQTTAPVGGSAQVPAQAPGTPAAAPAPPPAAAANPQTETPGVGATQSGAAAATAPAWRDVTVPEGTRLPIVLESTVGSDISRVEEPVHGRLARDVKIHGDTVLPEGSRVSGVVTDATRSGKVKGVAHIAVKFNTIVPRGNDAPDARYTIATATVARTAASTKKKDAMEIGGGGAGGALIGALVGGKKGALVGTAIGGGAGTAVVLSTRGKEVRLAKGTPLTLELSRPLTVRVRE